jgi:hypothetical protein
MGFESLAKVEMWDLADLGKGVLVKAAMWV